MNLLPHWVLTDKFPAFYDSESATAIEQTAKIYGAMQTLITEYNNFVDSVNLQITEFINDTNKDYEVFRTGLRQEFQDFIDVIDLKIKAQDKAISDKFEQQDADIENAINYMKTNLNASINAMLEELKESGELSEAILESLDLFAEIGVSVKKFGAVGDGTTDDTKAFTDCLAYCIENNCKMLIPEGTYLISSTILIQNHGVVIEGVGPGLTILKTESATPIFNIGKDTWDGSTDNWTWDDATYYVHIRDITFKGADSTESLVVMQSSSHGSIKSCSFEGGKIGLKIRYYNHWNIFSDLKFTSQNIGIVVTGEGATSLYNSTGCIYDNILILSFAYFGIQFTGVTFGDCCINNVNGVGNSGSYALIALQGAEGGFYASHMNISSCHCDGTCEYTILINRAYNISVHGITKGGDVNYLIRRLNYTHTNIDETGLTASETIDILGMEYVQISGDTTIQNIDGGWGGMTLTIRPLTNLTINNSGNIALPVLTATLKQNVFYQFRKISGYWFAMFEPNEGSES